jgi:hypothetical protein
MAEEKRPGVKKDHRKALNDWLERSAQVLEEYGSPDPRNAKK